MWEEKNRVAKRKNGACQSLFFSVVGFCGRVSEWREAAQEKAKTITCFRLLLRRYRLERAGGKEAGRQSEKMGLDKAFFFRHAGRGARQSEWRAETQAKGKTITCFPF